VRIRAVCRDEGVVEVGGNWSREARDNLLAGDEAIPFVVGRCAARVGVAGVAIVVAACQSAALVLCAVDRDFLAEDPSGAVETVPGNADENDTVADEQCLVAVLDLDPLELIRLRSGRVAKAIRNR